MLRLALGFSDHAFYLHVRFWENLHELFGLIGMALLIAISYSLCFTSRNRGCWIFLLAASPYILAMLLIGGPREIRLWMPIWLTLIVLADDRTSCGVPRAEGSRAALPSPIPQR